MLLQRLFLQGATEMGRINAGGSRQGGSAERQEAGTENPGLRLLNSTSPRRQCLPDTTSAATDEFSSEIPF